MFKKSDVKKVFNTDILVSGAMDIAIRQWDRIYSSHPEWIDTDEHIKTINFAKSVCSETARLTTLDLSIKLDGSARATYLQTVVDNMFDKIREYVEDGCKNGTIILKPNGEGVDCFDPMRFAPTDTDGNQNIRGAIFCDYYQDSDVMGTRYFTRLEYHRFESDGIYMISNRCFMSRNEDTLGSSIELTKTPWSNLLPDVSIENLERPLFAVFKTPGSNSVDPMSPLGSSVFADAIEELKDLDIAYSRHSLEIYESRRTVLADERLMDAKSIMVGNQRIRLKSKMPEFVKNVMGEDTKSFYQEINPNLNTETRIKGINSILSILAYKCGYSNGYFSFDQMVGIQTATGVEASQQRTIQFIKDVRDKLQMCMDDLIYAMDKWADLYSLAPVGKYEVSYGFGDITYNYEEDKTRWWVYVQAGKVPAWRYFVKFENMSEDEAKEMQEEVEKSQKGLFEDE